MKKLRTTMDRYFDRLDERWRVLPIQKQYQSLCTGNADHYRGKRCTLTVTGTCQNA